MKNWAKNRETTLWYRELTLNICRLICLCTCRQYSLCEARHFLFLRRFFGCRAVRLARWRQKSSQSINSHIFLSHSIKLPTSARSTKHRVMRCCTRNAKRVLKIENCSRKARNAHQNKALVQRKHHQFVVILVVCCRSANGVLERHGARFEKKG